MIETTIRWSLKRKREQFIYL